MQDPNCGLKECRVICRIGEWVSAEMELVWSHFPLSVSLLSFPSDGLYVSAGAGLWIVECLSSV